MDKVSIPQGAIRKLETLPTQKTSDKDMPESEYQKIQQQVKKDIAEWLKTNKPTVCPPSRARSLNLSFNTSSEADSKARQARLAKKRNNKPAERKDRGKNYLGRL